MHAGWHNLVVPSTKETPMTELKTQKNDASVDKYLAGIKDEQQHADCLAVLELMTKLTGDPAVMWGKAIVGFGSFHYRGKTTEGDWPPVAFSARKQNLDPLAALRIGEASRPAG